MKMSFVTRQVFRKVKVIYDFSVVGPSNVKNTPVFIIGQIESVVNDHCRKSIDRLNFYRTANNRDDNRTKYSNTYFPYIHLFLK